MAKQLVNPIERHVEKAALGVAGLILLSVIARYLVTSPNHIELGGEKVTPGTIQQKLAQQAARARERVLRAPADVEIPEPLYQEWESSLDPFGVGHLALTLSAAVPLGPEVPIIDPPEPVVGQKNLVPIAPASRTAFTTGRTTFLVTDRGGEPRRESVNWVTLSVVFNVKEQMAAQGREYGAARKEVVFGPVELQRRARREDGSWDDQDWKLIDPWPARSPPPIPSVTLVQEEDRLIVPREERNRLEQFYEQLREPELQLALIRPMMPERANGDRWAFPVITTERDVLVQDDYYLHQDKPPAADPGSRYSPAEERLLTSTVESPPPEELLAKAQALLKAAYENSSQAQATEAYNLARTVEDDDELSKSLRRRAADVSRRAEEAISDIKRQVASGVARSTAAGKDEKEFKREPEPFQQLWVHDARLGSVESGKTYQYRLRPLIYNRLAGEPDKFRNKTDATVIFIPGDWTEPMEVTIKPDSVFFVTSKDDRNQQIGVEFFKWFDGVWVKSRRFKMGVGDRVQGASRHQVPSWEDETVPENVRVDFAADATVIDIDFERPYRERKRGTTRDGVRFAAPRTACAVVYADSEGHLHERTVPTDKRRPDKRMFAAMVYKPPRDDEP